MVKRRDLLKQLKKIAKEENLPMEITEGGSHSIVTIGERTVPVPRHNEIGEGLSREIIKQAKGKAKK